VSNATSYISGYSQSYKKEENVNHSREEKSFSPSRGQIELIYGRNEVSKLHFTQAKQIRHCCPRGDFSRV